MNRTAPAAHADHDELLIARLYGDDVDESERALALDLVADCRECAELLADLGAIAEADSAMPVPPRPRDFSLTEDDAARLRRKRRGWSAVFGLGLRRSFGGSLAALGLVGVVLTSAGSLFTNTGAADLQSATGNVARVAAPDAASAGPPELGGLSMATSGPAGQTVPAAVSLPSDGAAINGAGNDGGTLHAGPTGALPAATALSKQASPEPAYNAGGETGQPSSSPEAETVQSGVDARLVWLSGFGALFAIGLAITIVPRRPRRSRGVRH